MGRFASALFAATVGCAVANGAAPINARLIGLFRAPGDPRSCSLLSINPNDGSNVTISEVYACINTTQTFPAFSAYDSASNSIRVVIATAPAIVAYDINTGSEVAQWQLPTYNASNPFLGLVTTGPLTAATTYLVTQFVIYKLAGTGLQPVVNVALPELAQVAATPAGIIYIADEAGATLYSIDMANGGILQKVTSGFSKPWDLQYSLALSSLVELGSYQLYVTNPTTGASKKILNIPDGPGYPRVNGIDATGATFFFIDFASIYTIDLASATILTKAPFTAAPRVVGYPIWASIGE